MSLIENCQPLYPILKKYKLYQQDEDFNIIEDSLLEFYIFPEDIKTSYQVQYSKLNSYGIYPYINLRTHSVTVRYGNREILYYFNKMIKESLESGIPLRFSTSSDYLNSSMDDTPPPPRFIPEEELPSLVAEGNVSIILEREREIDETLIDYENTLEDNLTFLHGFIEFPITISGVMGKGDLVDGFSFNIIEVIDSFRLVKVGDLEFKIPPDNYTYQEVGSSGSIQYSITNKAIINVGFVQKGFQITLPSAYTDVLETIKFYKATSLLEGGIEILDNVGNSFNGLGYVNSISYNGAINKKLDDLNENNFLPRGFSFSVLSLESFITS